MKIGMREHMEKIKLFLVEEKIEFSETHTKSKFEMRKRKNRKMKKIKGTKRKNFLFRLCLRVFLCFFLIVLHFSFFGLLDFVL